jgi:transcriptional regulator with XRE-family HTH domain
MTIAYEARRFQLGDFLRRRREALTPAEAGITIRDRRRTPGLRRDEVAERANMSVVYYERLERGRGPLPSPAMLGGIAKALRLNSEESDYLYTLVGQQAPATPSVSGAVDPTLLSAANAVAPTVLAVISDHLGTVLMQNAISAELFGSMAGAELPQANVIWRWFTEPRWRGYLQPTDRHDATSRFFVADLRASLARRCEDVDALAFLGNLLDASEEFREKWVEHAVATAQCLPKLIVHERVGPIALEPTMVLSPTSDQRLVLLQPAPDDEDSRARLRSLLS